MLYSMVLQHITRHIDSFVVYISYFHVDGWVQDCSDSIASTLELLQYYTKPSMWSYIYLEYSIAVLSKVQNRWSPNGPPMVDGWVVRITFGWSVYVVVRNDNKTLIMTSMPFVFHDHQGLYPKISLSLGRTRFLFKVLQSFWNLIGGLLLVVPSCLSNFKAIGNFQTTHSC